MMHHRRDGVTREGHEIAERLQRRHVLHQLAPDQRRQHDQKRKRQHAIGADQHIADQFQPQQPPTARLTDVVGAVETDAQAFDAARCEIEREQRAKGQRRSVQARSARRGCRSDRGAATCCGQASSRMRAASSASSFEPKKKPASAVTTIKNGNSAISVDSAIWLAMAQPSSARKAGMHRTRCGAIEGQNAQSARPGLDRPKLRNWLSGRALQGQMSAELGGLHVAEELPHFSFQAFRLDGDGVGEVFDVGGRRAGSVVTPGTRLMASAPVRASPEARLTPSAIEATAAFCWSTVARPCWRWPTCRG